MNLKLNKLKLITLSSLIFLGTFGYNNNHKTAAQQNNITSVEIAANKQINKKLPTAEIEGYTGAVQSCVRTGDSVACDVLITRTKENSNVKLFGSQAWKNSPSYSRIIDSNGNEYMASSIRTGSREKDKILDVDFMQGVPQKITLNFKKVPLEVNTLAAVEVNGIGFNLGIRDVVIVNPFLSRLH